MRAYSQLLLALCLLSLPLGGVAQTGSWQSVEALSPGTSISVLGRYRYQQKFHCDFSGASDDSLWCETRASRWHPSESLVFDRHDVEQVKTEHHAASILAGAGIGAGVIAIDLGIKAANSGSNASEVRSLAGLGALIGVALGGYIGSIVPIVPGHVIYSR